MWIKTIVLVGCVLATLGAEEQRPKKKDDPRGKRNLQYNIAHHYNGPHTYRLERRISTGPQIPSLYHSQFFPGPRSYSPYHKGRPHSLYPPPYAVQMEPLVHYSQRDPLYDTNTLSLNADGQDDLLTDNNHLSENVYGPQKHVIERPVYIKEPEPIIEIIIKESNVTLPPPPAPPTPPPKKKEQVQVFYVKYKKNPNGHGKESIIYDKPIPAISPPVQDEHEEEPPQSYHHQEVVTSAPPPSTTLRTIIHPDSETYHSPSGVKVTFGKESFDYDKRSSKPEDLKASPGDHRSVQFPQGRQLSSFPPSVPRRPSNHNYNPSSSNSRQPQPYRPFGFFRQQTPQIFQRPSPQQYSTLPKFPEFSQPPKNTQRFPPPRPVPPQFHQRQPVPYQPFETLRPQPPVQFRPQTHFPVTQAPSITEKPVQFNPFNRRPQFVEPRPQFNEQKSPPKPAVPPNHQPQYYQQPEVSHYQQFQRPEVYHQSQPQYQQQQQQQQRPVVPQQPPQQYQQQQPQYQQQQQQQQQPPQQYPQQQFQQPVFPPFGQQPSIIPPGGELIHSLPKFEQHISVSEPPKSSDFQENLNQYQQSSTPDYNQNLQQQLHEANAFQESVRHSSPQLYNFQQSQQNYQTTSKPTSSPQLYNFQQNYHTTSKPTPKPYSTTTTTTTTTQKPSTTTKDPKVLNEQLPDEVPDDLRQQLLSSGILNHADISVLDYDKVGDIPLSALPPDQLANFYSAGGAQQLAVAGSAPVPSIAKRDFDAEASERHEVTAKPEVEMKVVHYDPESDRGQQVQDAYVKEDAKQVEPVVLNDATYNRYLPLKVSGAQFPIPDVPELKGKKISSVVVLAPVKYDFSSSRQTRDAKEEEIELVEGQFLKELLSNPTKENFKRFLEHENRTRSDQQAVILLVAKPSDDAKEKEIFMYDLATRTVSKLNGELSSAFVEAAEANALKDDTKASASEIIETRVPYEGDLETEASEHFETFVDVSGIPVDDDLTASETRTSKTGGLA